jgi:hypothetical protein
MAVGAGWEVTWLDMREESGEQVILLAPFPSFLVLDLLACLSTLAARERRIENWGFSEALLVVGCHFHSIRGRRPCKIILSTIQLRKATLSFDVSSVNHSIA